MLYSLGWTPSLLHTVWSFHTGCWMSQRSISEHYFLPAKKKKERISEELLNRFIIKLNKNHKSMQWTVICIWYIYIFNEKIIKRYTYHHKRFFFLPWIEEGQKSFFFLSHHKLLYLICSDTDISLDTQVLSIFTFNYLIANF